MSLHPRILALVAFLLAFCPRPSLTADFRARLDLSGIGYPSLERVEARSRLYAAYDVELGEHWFFLASAHADGAAATGDRGAAGILRPLETYVEWSGDRADVRVGFSTLAWGVLDELSPQDVVSPVDVSRFALANRAEARLPVPLVRLRWFLPAETSVEAVLAPWARRGTFDQLDEPSSPFAPEVVSDLPRSDLPLTAANMEGGLRFRAMTRGLDWGASVYRDVVDFDRYQASPNGLRAVRPARVMLGGDVETARGAWVLRGEGALFLKDPLQAKGAPLVLERWSFQGGVGADRAFGDNLLFLNALYRVVPEDPRLDSTNEISIFGGYSRELARGTRNVRFFGAWNAREGSAFTRVWFRMELVENVQLELGGSAFFGDGESVLGLLHDSDFAAVRLQLYF